MLPESFHRLFQPHLAHDRLDLRLALFAPFLAHSGTARQLRPAAAAMRHDIRDPGSQRQTSRKTELPECRQSRVLGHRLRCFGLGIAVITLQRQILQAPGNLMRPVQHLASSISREVQLRQIKIHVDIEKRDVLLVEDLPDHRSDRERRGTLSGRDPNLAAESLPQKRFRHDLEMGGPFRYRHEYRGRRHDRRARVRPGQPRHIERVEFLGHRHRVPEGVYIVAAAGHYAVRFDSAYRDEDDIAALQIIRDLHLTQPGHIARVGLPDLCLARRLHQRGRENSDK